MTGCSGYRYTQQDNPLSQYGIQTLSVPMFFNFSNQADVSSNFTRETYRLLTSFKGLKLKSGYHPESDAVLICVLKSPEKVSLTLRPYNLRVAQTRAGTAIGDKRQRFYIPGTTEISMFLQVIVIKKPTEEELALLKSGIGDQVQLTSRIIFNETIPLKNQYAREVFDKTDTSDGVNITATQNAGIQRKVIRSMAEQAAISIRDMILYAF
jgi:hypothetical protein